MRIVSFLIVLLLPGTGLAAVWIEEPTTKVLKTAEEPAGAVAVSLEAARNDWEAFQVVVRAEGEALADVDMEMSDLDGPGGAVLEAGNALFYLEYYVDIEIPSPCDELFGLPECGGIPEYRRDPGAYPDALVPFYDPYGEGDKPVAVPFAVPAGDLQTVWVDFHVPSGTVPGLYEGELTVRAAGDKIASIPVSLLVWDFEIPLQRNIATSYGLVFFYIKRYHGGPEITDEQEKYFIRNYELELHRHRIDLEKHRASLDFDIDEEGNVAPMDFSVFDAVIGPKVDGSYYPDGAGINRFDLGYLRPGTNKGGLTDSQVVEASTRVAQHLHEKGWMDHVYIYSLDEPWQFDKWAEGSYDNIAHDAALLEQGSKLWKGHVMVTGPWVEALDEAVDIWCPDTNMYGGDYYGPGAWPGGETYQPLLKQDKELWFYVCRVNVPPFLGYDIDTKIGYEPRLLKWQAWHEGASGFLFWTTNYWYPPDPWHVLVKDPEKFVPEMDRNGNGILIYPGDHNGTKAPAGSPPWVSIDGPVMSLRIKQIRDGLEDWEMFLLAEQLGAADFVREQVARVHSSFAVPINEQFDLDNPPWTLDEHELLDVRHQVGLMVQHLSHPDLYPDPTATTLPEPSPEPLPDIISPEPPAEIRAADAAPAADAPPAKKPSTGCASTGRPNVAALLLAIMAMFCLRLARKRHCLLCRN